MSVVAWIRVGVLAAAFLFVEALCRSGAISPLTMPPPSTIVGSLGAILESRHMLGQIARTLADVSAALVLAVVTGFLLGAGLAGLPRLRAVIEPILASYYAIPVFVFYPFFVLVFGLNHYPRIAIGFLLAVVAMVVNTLNGFDRVPPVLLKSARLMHRGRLATVRHVILPFAALYLSTGLKLAVAYAFIGVIAAEFIRSGDGVGYEIAFAFNNFENGVMYPLILILLVVATTVNLGLQAWERRLHSRQTGRPDVVMTGPGARRPVLDGLVLVAVLAALWQLLHLAVGDRTLTSPWRTVVAAATLLQSPDVWPHLAETALALLQAYAIAVAVGLPAGLLLGAHRLSAEVAEPMLVALYAIPKITLYPIILLLFGIGMAAKVAFAAIHGVVPIVLFSMHAVRTLDPIYLRTARVPRLTPLAVARTILAPTAGPELFTGLRVGFALTLVGTLLGEMFASQRGLGYLLMQAMGVHNMQTILSLTLILVAFAVTVSVVLLRVDRRLHHDRRLFT